MAMEKDNLLLETMFLGCNSVISVRAEQTTPYWQWDQNRRERTYRELMCQRILWSTSIRILALSQYGSDIIKNNHASSVFFFFFSVFLVLYSAVNGYIFYTLISHGLSFWDSEECLYHSIPPLLFCIYSGRVHTAATELYRLRYTDYMWFIVVCRYGALLFCKCCIRYISLRCE